MAATDLNTVRSTIEARLATELASSPEGKFQTQIRITFNIYEDL